METLAPIEDLLGRLDWELDEQELRMARSALEDASNLVRLYGNSNWGLQVGDVEHPVPAMARSIALSAARRFMVNPDGYITSRAGDETVAWDGVGDKAAAVYLTDAEQRLCTRLATGASDLTSVPIFAWNSGAANDPYAGHVPVDGGRSFPMFDGRGPW